MAKFDVVLVHAPSVYDFRERDDILFAYLSNSDSVHVSPIFEMPPVGILAIKQYLNRCGIRTEFFNVASQMLLDPGLDVEEFLRRAEAEYFGVDLHWLTHAHGALELLRLYKELHPEAKTILGGIASTYHHEELIQYAQVDYVVRGFDTLVPIEQLIRAKNSADDLALVPNLTWKKNGSAEVNALSFVPDVYTAAVDWREVFSEDRRNMTPYNVVIPQAGCEYNCTWCGGSRYFFKKYMGLNKKSRVQKRPELLAAELESIAAANTGTHTVTMINFWHEYPALFETATDIFVDDAIDCVHFSLHRLPKVEKGRNMAAPANAVIELSPDSDDMAVARASGRGTYTMEEMEEFIDALIDEVHSFEIYFMLGLPKQTKESVRGTVRYCAHLLEKYRGRAVTPFICPMLPFLDPGSEIYDHPERFGYRIFHRSVEDHVHALVSLNWRDRLNYETEWLSREELVAISYEAVRDLTLLKKKHRVLPSGVADDIVRRIDATHELLADIDSHAEMSDGGEKATMGRSLKRRIREYNALQLSTVRSQQRPIDLGFSRQQWFDTNEAFAEVMEGAR